MIVAEYGAEGFKIGYIYAAAGLGFLAYAAYHGVLIILEELEHYRDERTLRELDRLESDDSHG